MAQKNNRINMYDFEREINSMENVYHKEINFYMRSAVLQTNFKSMVKYGKFVECYIDNDILNIATTMTNLSLKMEYFNVMYEDEKGKQYSFREAHTGQRYILTFE